MLYDPNDSRAEITLLHMPINTTKEAIAYIFNAINPEWKASDIRLEPGVEQRHDRWQSMLQCADINDIPHHFILPKRGPERENLKIKVFVSGKKKEKTKKKKCPLHTIHNRLIEITR